MQSKLIDWAEPKSLSRHIPQRIRSNLSDFEGGGGSGIVMQGGTLVFTLRARNGENQPFSRITYSTDNGNNWVFPEGISPAACFNPSITFTPSMFAVIGASTGKLSSRKTPNRE
ncbi:trans-sialidase, partial [Trypanosoma cruzi]